MFGVSAGYRTQLIQSHTIATLGEIWRGEQVFAGNLPMLDGTVTVDRTATTRRSCTASFIDPTGTLSGSPGDPMSVYGNEFRPYRGLYLSDGTLEMCPLGVFHIDEADVADDGARQVTITGYDRSWVISRNKLTDIWVINAGTNVGSAITALLQDRFPGLTCRMYGTVEVTPQAFLDQEADPWVEATKLAQAIGWELFIDIYGQAVGQPEPVATADRIDWTYADGVNSVMIKATKAQSSTPGINGVIVTGETTSSPSVARGEAWDNDQQSPTYYLGPYGKVPLFETSQYAATPAQAQAQAFASLQRNIGATEIVSIDCIPNPAHECGDSLQVVRAASDIASICTIDSFNVPLKVDGTMTIKTRARRSA